MRTTLMSDEEKHFMWSVAFFLASEHHGAAFRVYYSIRSFITLNGIFMARGYALGVESIWRRAEEDDKKNLEELEGRRRQYDMRRDICRG